jgi:hypothetical protein
MPSCSQFHFFFQHLNGGDQRLEHLQFQSLLTTVLRLGGGGGG